MCRFITGTIGTGTRIETLNEVSKPQGLKFEQIVNKYVQAQLPENTIYIWHVIVIAIPFSDS
jgi:hypothetical protein